MSRSAPQRHANNRSIFQPRYPQFPSRFRYLVHAEAPRSPRIKDQLHNGGGCETQSDQGNKGHDSTVPREVIVCVGEVPALQEETLDIILGQVMTERTYRRMTSSGI